MQLIQYCGVAGGNFGDDLNLQLWDRLFPNLADLQGKVLLYGVGTLLNGRHNNAARKVVLGTGIGSARAAMPDANWDFRWVRGPKTAAEFGLSGTLALGDAAILWPELTAGHDAQGPVGLIPHYATWDSFDWDHVTRDAGMVAINPRQAPGDVIAQLRGCSRILAESLHGAICADAMGIPWATCILAHRFNAFKWRDWLATIDRDFRPLVMDRPLVRAITPGKAMANRLARAVRYKARTRHPALRPIAASTGADSLAVSQQLRQFGLRAAGFSCSSPQTIARQRHAMRLQCEQFAQDYKLRFTPGALLS